MAISMLNLNSISLQAPTPVIDDTYNSPGTVGFIATFLVAVGAVLLFVDLARRVRRMRYREEIRSKLEDEDNSAEAQ
jgi:hypothetical protein